jgi:hypothetical protein
VALGQAKGVSSAMPVTNLTEVATHGARRTRLEAMLAQPRYRPHIFMWGGRWRAFMSGNAYRDIHASAFTSMLNRRLESDLREGNCHGNSS